MSTENLKAVFPNYAPISEALTCPPDTGFGYESWAIKERAKIYTSLDRSGNVWGVQNPNAWKRIYKDGQLILQRPKPNLIMKAADFKKACGGSYERKKKFDDFGDF